MSGLFVASAVIVVMILGASVRIVRQNERGVVFRFGRVIDGITRGPGIALLAPFVDRMQKINMQIVTIPVPAQDGITRDNVTIRVDAVIYLWEVDPIRVAVEGQDHLSTVGQLTQTSLRSIIGKSDLDDLLTNRAKLNQGMELLIDSPAVDWGLHIDRLEIKDVTLPTPSRATLTAPVAEPVPVDDVDDTDGSVPSASPLRRPAMSPTAIAVGKEGRRWDTRNRPATHYGSSGGNAGLVARGGARSCRQAACRPGMPTGGMPTGRTPTGEVLGAA